MEVVAERGLIGTTLRHVADKAGVSVGLVQRYFVSKDALLHFGFEHVYQRTHDRVASVPVVPPVREIILGIAEAILPLDSQRRRESQVWLAFVHTSLNDEQMAETHQKATAELVDGLREALEGAQRHGELNATIDTRSEALALTAFLDGLVVNGISTGLPDDVLRTLLRGYLDRLFEENPR